MVMHSGYTRGPSISVGRMHSGYTGGAGISVGRDESVHLLSLKLNVIICVEVKPGSHDTAVQEPKVRTPITRRLRLRGVWFQFFISF
jgi:hypothetical protein